MTPADLSPERQAYELPEIWDADFFGAEDRARFAATANMVPRWAKSVLDVGCGNGLFAEEVRRLLPEARVVGIDRSVAATSAASGETMVGDISALPFEDGSFEVITCNEVLEHLPLATYEKALSELARVASRVAIVSVPYMQELRDCLSECPKCATRFNADYHMRSFIDTEPTNGRLADVRLSDLLAPFGFKLTGKLLLGESVVRHDQLWRARLAAAFAPTAPPQWWPYAVCPVCGFSTPEALRRDLEAKKAAKARPIEPQTSPSALRSFLRRTLPSKTTYRWIAAAYARD